MTVAFVETEIKLYTSVDKLTVFIGEGEGRRGVEGCSVGKVGGGG